MLLYLYKHWVKEMKNTLTERKPTIQNIASLLGGKCERLKTFANGYKTFIITNFREDFDTAKIAVNDSNLSSVAHMIDLSKYEHDKAYITFTSRAVWKSVRRVAKSNSIRNILLTDSYTISNGVGFNPAELEVFKLADGPAEFYKFYEKRNEYTIDITLVNKGKVIAKLDYNNSMLTAIYTNKEFEFTDKKGSEVQADRISANNPIIKYDKYEFVCRFNEQNEENKLLIDMYTV